MQSPRLTDISNLPSLSLALNPMRLLRYALVRYFTIFDPPHVVHDIFSEQADNILMILWLHVLCENFVST